jgi:acetyl esterase
MLTSAEMDAFWANYLRDERDLADPLVCPLSADLHDLPPVLLVVAACDILAEQSHALARRLTGAGVDATLSVYHGASHSFLEAVATVPLAEGAMADASAWLRGALALPHR